jgi:hypothetical protein
VNNLAETAGYLMIVAFLYFMWPPLALLGAGLLLVAWANVRASRATARSGRTSAAIGAAFAAARRVYTQHDGTPELRRVA